MLVCELLQTVSCFLVRSSRRFSRRPEMTRDLKEKWVFLPVVWPGLNERLKIAASPPSLSDYSCQNLSECGGFTRWQTDLLGAGGGPLITPAFFTFSFSHTWIILFVWEAKRQNCCSEHPNTHEWLLILMCCSSFHKQKLFLQSTDPVCHKFSFRPPPSKQNGNKIKF